MTKPIKLTWTGYQSLGRTDVVAEYAPKRKSEMGFACRYRTLIVKGRGGYYIQVNSERFKAWGQAGPDVFVRDGIYKTKEAAMQAVEDYMNEKERTLIEEWEDSIAQSEWIIREVYIDYHQNNCRRELHPNAEPIRCSTEAEAKQLVKKMELENNYPKTVMKPGMRGYENGYVYARAYNPVTRYHIGYSTKDNRFHYAHG